MPVVSNTSPILNLAVIRRLGLLKKQFVQVLIPPAVLAELRTETEFPGAETIRQAIQDRWLVETTLQNTNLERALALELDRGEAAAIALALELSIPTVLMDERDGRAKAKSLGLQPAGLLGVLLRAKRDGDLDSVKDAMRALRHDAGFFIRDDLLAQILTEAGER